jgi:hypothetical protein
VKSIDEGKLSLINQKQNGLIEFVGRTRVENGIKGYTKKLDLKPNPKDIISVTQIGTIVAQLRKEEWYASQNIFSLTPKEEYKNLISLYGVASVDTVLRATFSDGYANYPTLEKLKNLKIKLPTKNGRIDFDFIEEFVAELEAERLAELEAYLAVANLQNYRLTTEEKKVLRVFENGDIKWGKYQLADLFDIKTVKSFDEGKLELVEEKEPHFFEFIGRTRNSNGVKGYVEKLAVDPNPGNVISISQIGTIVAQLRREEWYASQNIFSLSPKNDYENLVSLFGVSIVNKALGVFSDGYSSYPTLKKLDKLPIHLPIIDRAPDYNSMKTLISAIQKIVIREVVLYADQKIAATKQVIK